MTSQLGLIPPIATDDDPDSSSSFDESYESHTTVYYPPSRREFPRREEFPLREFPVPGTPPLTPTAEYPESGISAGLSAKEGQSEISIGDDFSATRRIKSDHFASGVLTLRKNKSDGSLEPQSVAMPAAGESLETLKREVLPVTGANSTNALIKDVNPSEASGIFQQHPRMYGADLPLLQPCLSLVDDEPRTVGQSARLREFEQFSGRLECRVSLCEIEPEVDLEPFAIDSETLSLLSPRESVAGPSRTFSTSPTLDDVSSTECGSATSWETVAKRKRQPKLKSGFTESNSGSVGLDFTEEGFAGPTFTGPSFSEPSLTRANSTGPILADVDVTRSMSGPGSNQASGSSGFTSRDPVNVTTDTLATPQRARRRVFTRRVRRVMADGHVAEYTVAEELPEIADKEKDKKTRDQSYSPAMVLHLKEPAMPSDLSSDSMEQKNVENRTSVAEDEESRGKFYFTESATKENLKNESEREINKVSQQENPTRYKQTARSSAEELHEAPSPGLVALKKDSSGLYPPALLYETASPLEPVQRLDYEQKLGFKETLHFAGGDFPRVTMKEPHHAVVQTENSGGVAISEAIDPEICTEVKMSRETLADGRVMERKIVRTRRRRKFVRRAVAPLSDDFFSETHGAETGLDLGGASMSDRSSSEASSFSEDPQTKEEKKKKEEMSGYATHGMSLFTQSGSMYDTCSRRETVTPEAAFSSATSYVMRPEKSYSPDGFPGARDSEVITAEFQCGGEYSPLNWQQFASEGGRSAAETGPNYLGRRFGDASKERPDFPGDYQTPCNLELNPYDRSQSATPVNFPISDDFSENFTSLGLADQTGMNIAERGEGSRSTTGDDEEEEDWDMCAMDESQDSRFAVSSSAMKPVNPDGKTHGKTSLGISSARATSRDRKISPMEISTSSEISGASEEASGMSDSLEGGGDWWKVEEENAERGNGSGEDLGTVSRNISAALDELNNLAESAASVAPLGRRSEGSEKDRRTLRDRH